MADSAKIKTALGQLDPENDNHWTTAGEPRIDTVKMLAGDQGITRADITEADASFNRQSAKSAAVPPAPPEGTITGDQIPPAPPVGQVPDAPQAADVDGKEVPPAPPLPTAPAADQLPTAAEPTAVEGAEPQGTHVEQDTPDVEGGPVGRPPQITEGTTEKGYNALNSEADDLRDAQASTAPSPNAPAELGGAPDARQVGGLTNEAGGDESTEQRPGEAQLSAVDHGADGAADEVASLEAELEALSGNTDALRKNVDDAQAELDKSMARQSELRVAIEKARPHGGTMPAIQAYFKSVDETATRTAKVRQEIVDSGLDFGQLKAIVENSATGKLG